MGQLEPKRGMTGVKQGWRRWRRVKYNGNGIYWRNGTKWEEGRFSQLEVIVRLGIEIRAAAVVAFTITSRLFRQMLSPRKKTEVGRKEKKRLG